MAKEPQLPKEVQISDFKKLPERSWMQCKECKEQVFREPNGKTFYHRISCSKSNGVKYTKDRS